MPAAVLACATPNYRDQMLITGASDLPATTDRLGHWQKYPKRTYRDAGDEFISEALASEARRTDATAIAEAIDPPR